MWDAEGGALVVDGPCGAAVASSRGHPLWPSPASFVRRGSNSRSFSYALADWLDGKHVVFGKVMDSESMLVVRKIENVPTGGKGNRPQLEVVISECGEL